MRLVIDDRWLLCGLVLANYANRRQRLVGNAVFALPRRQKINVDKF